MHNEQQEIMRHAVVGGLVAVSLAAFHEIAETLAKELFGGKNVLLRIVEWLTLFSVVFAAILLIEAYLRRRQWRAKISLADIGVIDGRWLDVVVNRGEIRAAGISEISSATGEGFRIRGIVYEFGPTGINRAAHGRWSTLQGTVFGSNGIAYVFEGETPAKTEHFGVGYTRFMRGRDQRELRSEGAFLARQEDDAFHTTAIRLNEGTPNSLTDDEVFAILDDFVKRPEVCSRSWTIL